MNSDEGAALAALKTSWMTGGSAAGAAPTAWRHAVAGAATGEAELRLVAIAGQALQMAYRPSPPPGLQPRKDLPQLALGVLPDAARPLFRRALKQADEQNRQRGILALLAARGHAAHPADWLPDSGADNIPDLYAPWQDWVTTNDQSAEAALDELTDESWDLFYPAERRMHLKAIRLTAPDQARALLAANAGGEPAEKRVSLIEIMAFNLSDADAEYLESLATDRSGKVRALAAGYLARLGRSAVGDVEQELAGFLKSGRSGLLRRQAVYQPNKLKTPAQHARRHEMFEQVSLDGLASVLGASQRDIVTQWDFGTDETADQDLVALAVRTGGDDVITALFERLLQDRNAANDLLGTVSPRLGSDMQRQSTAAAMASKVNPLSTALACSGDDVGWLPREMIFASPALKGLKNDIRQSNKDEGGAKAAAVDRSIAASLFQLGLLASNDAAAALIDDLTSSGLLAADLRLDTLRLNALLEHDAKTGSGFSD